MEGHIHSAHVTVECTDDDLAKVVLTCDDCGKIEFPPMAFWHLATLARVLTAVATDLDLMDQGTTEAVGHANTEEEILALRKKAEAEQRKATTIRESESVLEDALMAGTISLLLQQPDMTFSLPIKALEEVMGVYALSTTFKGKMATFQIITHPDRLAH